MTFYPGMTEQEIEMIRRAAQIREQVKQQTGVTLSDDEVIRIMNVPGGGSTIPTGQPVKPAIPDISEMPLPETGYISKERAQALVAKIQAERQKEQYEEKKRQDEEVKQKLYVSEKATPSIPFERKYYEAIDFGDNAGRNIYRSLTPWAEEKGEKIKDYIVSIPERMTGKYDTQERLEERYNTEQSHPLWTRLLLGGDTVIKNEKGEYFSIVAGEAPLITPAKSTTTIPVNFYKILQNAKKAKLAESWDNTLEILARSKKWGTPITPATGKYGSSAINLEKIAKGQINLADAVYKSRKIQDAEWAALQAEKAARAARNTENISKIFLLPIPQLYIEPDKASRAITELVKTIEPEKAINELNETKLTPIITISNPEVITKLLTEVEPEIQSKVIIDVEQAIKEATETETLTETQSKEATKIINAIKTDIQEQTKTETQAQTQTETETQTKLKSSVATKTATDITYPYKIKPTERPGQPKQKEPSTPKKPKLRTKGSEQEDEEKRKVIKEAGGAVAWPQGKLNDKTVWHVIIAPFDNPRHLVVLGVQPEGAVNFPGPGQAYKSIKTLYGKGPAKPVKIEGGIADPVITSSKGKININFIHDKKAAGRKTITYPSDFAPDVVIKVKGGKKRRVLSK